MQIKRKSFGFKTKSMGTDVLILFFSFFFNIMEKTFLPIPIYIIIVHVSRRKVAAFNRGRLNFSATVCTNVSHYGIIKFENGYWE